MYIYIKKSSSQPKWCLNATSKITTKMVSFFTSFHVLLVHIHKFKLRRLAATSKQENGRKLEEKESWPWSTKNKASLGVRKEKMRSRENAAKEDKVLLWL